MTGGNKFRRHEPLYLLAYYSEQDILLNPDWLFRCRNTAIEAVGNHGIVLRINPSSVPKLANTLIKLLRDEAIDARSDYQRLQESTRKVDRDSQE